MHADSCSKMTATLCKCAAACMYICFYGNIRFNFHNIVRRRLNWCWTLSYSPRFQSVYFDFLQRAVFHFRLRWIHSTEGCYQGVCFINIFWFICMYTWWDDFFLWQIEQFRYIKIQPSSWTIDLSTRLCGITTEFGSLFPILVPIAHYMVCDRDRELWPGGCFSKVPETFRARKAIFRSSVSENGE